MRLFQLVAVVLRSSLAMAALLGMAIAGAGALVSMGAVASPVDVTLEPLPDFAPLPIRSIVRARDGSVLAVLREEDRANVALADVPEVLVKAVVAAEDSRFWDHQGVDIRGTVRAALTNVSSGKIDQGGSTITQQLVKNGLLTRERDLDRKIHEAILAVRLERHLDKRQILERYLNTVYFGQSAYGLQTAAERFFAKNAKDLDLPESALLAGLISNPEGANPFKNPEQAKARRDYVLDRMLAARYLTPEEAAQARQAPLPTAPHDVLPAPRDYFVEEVKHRLLRDERLGATYLERYERVFRGGLHIHTTLDPNLQALASRAVTQTLPPSPFTASVVAIDPANGEVRALVGGPNFEQAKFNLATQGARQPGSAFKTVTLAAAVEAGYSPDDQVDAAAPCQFPLRTQREPWLVDNYDGGSGGVVSLREATAKSYNCAYARLVLGLGAPKVADMAARLGIQRKLDVVPAMTLGAEEASPVEMATVAATLAADGVRHDPVFIRRVEAPDGKPLIDGSSPGTRVVPPEVARTVTHVLQDVITGGTGQRANINRPAAGKTGTSQEWRDAWFLGYTPHLAAAVWMGHPAGQVSMSDVGGIRVTGGSYPASIWSAFMGPALAGEPPAGFPAPDMSKWPPPLLANEQGRLAPAPPQPPPAAAPAPAPAPKPEKRKDRNDDD